MHTLKDIQYKVEDCHKKLERAFMAKDNVAWKLIHDVMLEMTELKVTLENMRANSHNKMGVLEKMGQRRLDI